MSRKVREPIQVYLTERERNELDRWARKLGVSRSEVLRRGISALGGEPVEGAFESLVDEGMITPPLADRVDLPTTTPVAPLSELLAELRDDRDGR